MATKKKKAEGAKLNTFRAGPDEQGFFGLFGGRFVAETLMPLILELERAYEDAKARSRVPGRAGPAQHALRRPAEPALFRRAPDRASRRRQDLLQARRAQPHRQPQDQQLPRPDPARQAHGQDAHHRRDRRRPARRGGGHRLRQLRHAVRDLHGRRRRRAAEAQRVPHEAAGRQGQRRHLRRADAEGRHERGAARLGHQRAQHLLHHRHGGRPASLSGHGARLPVA